VRAPKDKVEEILKPAVGAGNVVAIVDVELDTSQKQETIEKFETGIISTNKTTKETVVSAANKGKGAPGVVNNVPGRVDVSNPEGTAAAPSAVANNIKETNETTHEIPKHIQTVLHKGARVKKITAAVSIARKEGQDWPQDKMQDFEKLVLAAIGSDTAGKENIVVSQFDFEKAESVSAAPPVIDTVVTKVDQYMDTNIVKSLLGGVLLIVLLLFYKKIFTSERVESQEVTGESFGGDLAPVGAGVPMGPGGAPARLVDGGTAAPQGQQQERLEEQIEQTPEQRELMMLRKATAREPKALAAVIESWVMYEDKK